MTPRIHYSAEPLESVRSVSQKRMRVNGKPTGLWYSVGEAWRELCAAEEFGLDRLAVATVLDLDFSRFMLIDSVPGIERFADEYSCEMRPGSRLYGIDWPRVALSFAGIEINPYLWPARLDPRFIWYYGWDCASGCVWDAGAVLCVHPISSPNKRRHSA